MPGVALLIVRPLVAIASASPETRLGMATLAGFDALGVPECRRSAHLANPADLGGG
jgi:hypothetical protein